MKILIGIVTSDNHRYCLKNLLEAIKSQTHYDYDLVFVDNSKEEYKDLNETGFKVIKDRDQGVRIKNIINGRNMIREEVLKRGYDYLFFVDSDVILPNDALEKLLSHKKDVVSGVYITVLNDNGRPNPVPAFTHPRFDKIVPFSFSDIDGGLKEIGVGGLGCCLIKSEVLKKIKFTKYIESETGGEDSAFFNDVRRAGYVPYADTSVKAFHMSFPEGDSRNRHYEFPSQSFGFSYTVNYG